MTTKIVGLDLGLHTVKACELVTTFRNFELVGFSTEPVEAQEDERPDFSELAQAAKRLLERRGLLGETLFCALPAHTYSTVVLEFPFDQPKKIESVLPFQINSSMRASISTTTAITAILRPRVFANLNGRSARTNSKCRTV